MLTTHLRGFKNCYNSRMKLLLASNDFQNQEVANVLAQLVGKELSQTSIAIINEAYAMEEGDKRWNIEELGRVSKAVGGEIDLVSLLALDKTQVVEKIMSKDVIFVVGGHTDYLMSVFNKTGFTEMLPELLKEKVYMGSSAGSMVMCKRVSTSAYLQIYGEGDDYGITKYMEFVDFAIKPHLNSTELPNRTKEAYVKASEGYQGIIYGLRDDQAIVVEDDSIKFIGGNPLTISNGKVVT